MNKTKIAQLKEHLMKEFTLFSLTDRNTGIEFEKFSLGRNWHWYLILVLAFIRFVLKHG